MYTKKIYLNNERLKEAFSVFDKDNNGVITKDEIMSVLKLTDGENDEIDNIIRNADKNGDGVIDKDEFIDLMRE